MRHGIGFKQLLGASQSIRPSDEASRSRQVRGRQLVEGARTAPALLEWLARLHR